MIPIVLYGERYWDSPYVFTVFVALREKGLAFDTRTLDLQAGEHRDAAYRDDSLTARVPALRHGDFWLSESSAIVDYLEEAFPAPTHPRILPASLEGRARARQVLAWLRSDLSALRTERPTTTMFFERATTPLSPKAARDAEKLIRVAAQLLGARHSITEEHSIADADLAFALHRLILNADPVPSELRAYAETEWARPSVRAFVEHDRAPLGKS